jgi:predicted Zn-dependent protease with MMP-like domain
VTAYGTRWIPVCALDGDVPLPLSLDDLAGALVLAVKEQARDDHRVGAEEDALLGRFAAVALLAVDVLRSVRDGDDIARFQHALLDQLDDGVPSLDAAVDSPPRLVAVAAGVDADAPQVP